MFFLIIFEMVTTLLPIAIWIFIVVKIIRIAMGKDSLSKKMKDMAKQNGIDNNWNNNGTANPKRYSTINSHYSQQTLNGSDHNHAYEHKVQPIEEASVHERFEDRKEAYIERKQQMKADLPKTSYSKMEEMNKGYVMNNSSQNSYNNYGQNGDVASAGSSYEENITCKYCGAQNIVPKSRTKAYNCYFCREVI